MNILVIVDLEGITGVYNLNQIEKNIKLMCKEVIKVLDELLSYGFTIYVCDCHNDGNNIRELYSKYSQITFFQQLWSIDFSLKYDFAMLVGFHTRFGVKGNFPHSFRNEIVSIKWGNSLVGETELIKMWLENKKIKVILISGEDKCIRDEFKGDSVVNISKKTNEKHFLISYEKYYKNLTDSIKKSVRKIYNYKISRLSNNKIYMCFKYKFIYDLVKEYGFVIRNEKVVFENIDELFFKMPLLCNILNVCSEIYILFKSFSINWDYSLEERLKSTELKKLIGKDLFDLSFEEIKKLEREIKNQYDIN